ncbi:MULTISPECIES: flavin reductase family protein [unclassified Variovorax]|uniref:flavin reductase family protein n=1 Tax=unclassified Variovorax TaxID=663243 RepID=UPI001BD4BABC|nr:MULTISPECIES: flavin reductase family protein [unclassified Variovorax]
MATSFDPKLFRDVMGHFATGVTVVSYLHEGDPCGMTANAFMSVSLDPPLAVISVRRAARFAAVVKEGDRFGVNFLLESQQDLSTHFGGRPVAGRPSPFETHDGTPLLRDSLAQLVLKTVDVHEAGDHLLYIGQVEHMALGVERKPLVFYSGAYKQVNIHAPQVFWASNDGW